MSQSPPLPPSNVASMKRIPALDGLRGLAILMVVFHHFYFWGWHSRLWEDTPWISAFMLKLTFLSAHGVDLFLVLSGFLIAGILLDSKGRDRYYGRYYLHRAVRILPLYYGCLALVFLVVPFLGNQRFSPFSEQGYYWLFLGNLKPAITVPGLEVAHFWSVAVQVQFYLAFPLLVYLLPRRALKGLLVAVVAATPFIRLALGMAKVPAFAFLFPAVADQLAAGCLVAVWIREEGSRLQLRDWSWRAAFVVVPVFLAVMFLPRRWHGVWFDPVSHSAVTLFYGLVLMAVLTAPDMLPLNRVLNVRFLGIIGKYSYGMYAFHYLLLPPFVVLASRWGFGVEAPHKGIAFLIFAAVGFLGTFVLAWLSWHLYEKHFLKLKLKDLPFKRFNVSTFQRSNVS